MVSNPSRSDDQGHVIVTRNCGSSIEHCDHYFEAQAVRTGWSGKAIPILKAWFQEKTQKILKHILDPCSRSGKQDLTTSDHLRLIILIWLTN